MYDAFAATLRDKDNYVDLTGLAKVRWTTRASGFHAVRPLIKLMDGTFLVGDHAESSTTTFLESEFAFAGLRWIRLDIDRIVTIGRYGPWAKLRIGLKRRTSAKSMRPVSSI